MAQIPSFLKKYIDGVKYSPEHVRIIFEKKEQRENSIYESLSCREDCISSYRLHDSWFHDLAWRNQEPKDISRVGLYQDMTPEQKRASVMIQLQGISCSITKNMHACAFDAYKILKLKYERVIDLIEFLNIPSLSDQYKRMSESVDEAHRCMMPLCVSLAASYCFKFGMSFEDAFQNAQLAVIQASRVYDPSSSVPFVQFCYYKIFTSLRRGRTFMVGSVSFNIPETHVVMYHKIDSYIYSFHQKNDRFPSDVEIKNHFGCSLEDVHLAHMYLSSDPYNEVYKKLEEDVGGVESSDNPFDVVSRNQDLKALYEKIDALDDPMRRVVQSMLPGYGDPLTREEVAHELNLTVRQVGDLRKKAIDILKLCFKQD